MPMGIHNPQRRDSLTTFSFHLGERNVQVSVRGDLDRGEFEVMVEGKTYHVQVLGEGPGGRLTLSVENRVRVAKILRDNLDSIVMLVEGVKLVLGKSAPSSPLKTVLRATAPRPVAVSKGELTSQIPGRVVKVVVKEGQRVKTGETLVILESMKMETAVKSDLDGSVKDVKVKDGQSVSIGTVLVVLAQD